MQHLVIDKQDSQLTLERERLILRHDSLARPLTHCPSKVDDFVDAYRNFMVLIRKHKGNFRYLPFFVPYLTSLPLESRLYTTI